MCLYIFSSFNWTIEDIHDDALENNTTIRVYAVRIVHTTKDSRLAFANFISIVRFDAFEKNAIKLAINCFIS